MLANKSSVLYKHLTKFVLPSDIPKLINGYVECAWAYNGVLFTTARNVVAQDVINSQFNEGVVQDPMLQVSF